MDRLRAIEYFVRAAELGSVSAAATAVGVSAAAVSKLLRALELRLGTTLFLRTAQGLQLTRDGEAYLAHCTRILQDVENAEAVVAVTPPTPRGTLVVGMPPTLAANCIAPSLGVFRVRYSQIELRIKRAYRYLDVAAQGLDALVMLGWVTNDDVVCRRVAVTRQLICASPQYWADAGTPQHPSELDGHSCLVYCPPEGNPLDEWTFDNELGSVCVRLRPKAVYDEQTWLIADALNGGGVIRVIDLTVLRHLDRGDLVPVLLNWESTESPPVQVLYRSRARRNERVRVWVQFVTELFAELQRKRLPPTARLPGVPAAPGWWRPSPRRRSASR